MFSRHFLYLTRGTRGDGRHVVLAGVVRSCTAAAAVGSQQSTPVARRQRGVVSMLREVNTDVLLLCCLYFKQHFTPKKKRCFWELTKNTTFVIFLEGERRMLTRLPTRGLSLSLSIIIDQKQL